MFGVCGTNSVNKTRFDLNAITGADWLSSSDETLRHVIKEVHDLLFLRYQKYIANPIPTVLFTFIYLLGRAPEGDT